MKRFIISLILILGLLTGIQAQNMIVGISGGDSTAIGLNFIPVIIKKGSDSKVYLVNGAITSKTFDTHIDSLMAQSAESWVKVVTNATKAPYTNNDIVLVNRAHVIRATKQSDGTTKIWFRNTFLNLTTDTDYDTIVIDVVDGF